MARRSAAQVRSSKQQRDFTLEVPAFVTMPMIHHLIERAQPILTQAAPFRRFIIDASRLALITPVGLATLASIAMLAARSGRFERGFIRDPKRPNVRTYLSRMNFNRLVRLRESASERAHRKPRIGRFQELVEVTSDDECNRVPALLCGVLRRQAKLTPVAISNLMYCLSELLDNVLHHAESPTHGIACAQAFRKSQAVELAIVDCGIGIRGSLRKNPLYADRIGSDEDAVKLSLQKGVTSTPGRNTGEGLFFVSQILTRSGALRIQSGAALVITNRGKMEVKRRPSWPGTLVGLRFQIEKVVPIREVFDQFARPDDEDQPLLFSLEELRPGQE